MGSWRGLESPSTRWKQRSSEMDAYRAAPPKSRRKAMPWALAQPPEPDDQENRLEQGRRVDSIPNA